MSLYPIADMYAQHHAWGWHDASPVTDCSTCYPTPREALTMTTTPYPAELSHHDDEHDDAVTVTFRDVRVTITFRSRERAEETGTSPDTVLVLVDDEREGDGPISIQVNDSYLFEHDGKGLRRYAGDDGILRAPADPDGRHALAAAHNVRAAELTREQRVERAARADYDIPARLDSIRASIRDESVSYGELAELGALREHIPAGDVELLEWAGVPEHDDHDDARDLADERGADYNDDGRL